MKSNLDWQPRSVFVTEVQAMLFEPVLHHLDLMRDVLWKQNYRI